jgi:hypothetical protein
MVRVQGLNNLVGQLQQQQAYCQKYVDFLTGQRVEMTKDIHDCLSTLVFPDLPACERRIELMAALTGMQASMAMHLLAFLHRSLPLDGDVCEFGVASGLTSAMLANELLATAKQLWLFDSFQGLPKPSEKDTLLHDVFQLGAMENYQGTMAYEMRQVEARLAEIGFPPGRAQIVPGFVEDTLRDPRVPAKVCFAFVDLDFYAPIQSALEFLHERLAPGGIALVHDYGHFSAGAQAAVDEFVAQHASDYAVISTERLAPHCRALQRR